jgi:hypothetical protein
MVSDGFSPSMTRNPARSAQTLYFAKPSLCPGRQNSVTFLFSSEFFVESTACWLTNPCGVLLWTATSHKHGTGGLHSSTGLGLLPLFEIRKAACLDVQVSKAAKHGTGVQCVDGAALGGRAGLALGRRVRAHLSPPGTKAASKSVAPGLDYSIKKLDDRYQQARSSSFSCSRHRLL